MNGALTAFLTAMVVVRAIMLLMGALMVFGGVALLWSIRQGKQGVTNFNIDLKQGTLKLTGAIPAVILIVLGGSVILFAAFKPFTVKYKQADGTELTGTGGPESGLRHLPPLLDSLVRGPNASAEGFTLATDSDAVYVSMDLLQRAWDVEKACERSLEGSAAEIVGITTSTNRHRYFPAILDSLVRREGASTEGLIMVGDSGTNALSERAARVLAACSEIIATDRNGNAVRLGDRVRSEGPQ
jgi:hypothetical protein